MKLRFVYYSLALWLLLLSSAFAANPAGTFTSNIPTSWNGFPRYYDLYVPENLPANPALWVMLHPTTSSTALPTTFDKSPMIALAAANGFVVIWPKSTWVNHSWYWDAYFLDFAFVADPDDSGFLCNLISGFVAEYQSSQVFVAGMSSGGFMAHRVANECPLVSAFGAASAQLYAENTSNSIPPAANVPSGILLNGDVDLTVPYCGNARMVNWDRTASPASDVSLDYWAGVVGYSGTLPQLCTDGQPTEGVDGALVQSNGVTVEFVREVGVGHTWVPGTETVMWEFFEANGRQPQ